MEAIKTKFGPNLDWAVVAHECHENGDHHRHCVITLKNAYDSSAPSDLDILTGKHGNYQSARNPLQVLRYSTKDGNFLSYQINVEQWISAKDSKKAPPITGCITTMVTDGCTLQDIDKQYPGFVMMNKKKIEDYLAWKCSLNVRNSLETWHVLKMTPGYSPSDTQIATWLNANLDLSVKKRNSSLQLFIYGKTCMGKTTLITALRSYFSVYIIPKDEDFNCNYDDTTYDLAIMDEFKGNKTVQWLNNWLDGTPFLLKKKASPGYTKLKNIPTIILSNFPLRECYPNISEDLFDTISRRLTQIEVTVPISIKI